MIVKEHPLLPVYLSPRCSSVHLTHDSNCYDLKMLRHSHGQYNCPKDLLCNVREVFSVRKSTFHLFRLVNAILEVFQEHVSDSKSGRFTNRTPVFGDHKKFVR